MQSDLYDDLAERVVHGAQERFVAELTERLVEMLRAGVAEPDRYAVALAAAHAECMGVWARWEGRVSAEVEAAFREALGQADEEIVESLAAAHSDGVSPLLRAQATAAAVDAIGEAARATASIVRRQNVALSQTAPDAYYAALGEALTRLEMGEGREAVMARAMAAMADAGIETVDYRSGRRTTIDAAVRRHVVTQQSQCRADLLERRMDEWGHDLVFTSSHYGARPTHAVWQGRVFSRTGATPGYRTLAEGTGYGSPAGLCGCNCRHSFFPYTKQTKLPSRDFSAQEARTGLTSDEYYAATQRQRAYEREVRKVKREVGLGQRDGHDMAAQRMRLGVLQRRLREHCEANALRRDYSRERAYGVAGQPRALILSMAENRARQERKAYRVDTRRVQSKGYASMVRGQFGACGDMALADARRMLAHRAGTACEDLYAYDLTEGRRLGSITSSKARQSVEPSERMRERVAAAVRAGHDVATLHNHPGSSMPSAADLRALKASGARMGAIAAHDGTLYTYELVGEPAPGYNLDQETLRTVYDNRAQDEAKALEAMEQLLGVRIVHLSPRGRGVSGPQPAA